MASKQEIQMVEKLLPLIQIDNDFIFTSAAPVNGSWTIAASGSYLSGMQSVKGPPSDL